MCFLQKTYFLCLDVSLVIDPARLAPVQTVPSVCLVVQTTIGMTDIVLKTALLITMLMYNNANASNVLPVVPNAIKPLAFPVWMIGRSIARVDVFPMAQKSVVQVRKFRLRGVLMSHDNFECRRVLCEVFD